MKHKICCCLLFLFACNILYAQDTVFIYNGHKKESFTVNNSVKYVKFYGVQNKNPELLYNSFKNIDTIMPDVFKITLDYSDDALFQQTISEIDSIFVADELIYKGDNTRQCCFNHILLQTKNSVDLSQVLENNDVPFSSFEMFGLRDNEYLVRLSVSEALYYANLLFETGNFVYSQPSFYRFNVFDNPLYPDQWGLKNTGQINDSVVGIDINVEPAWEISTGEGVKVAVIDNGVQLNHPDLEDNLLSGYDATGGGSNGGHTNNDSHGTCCAGIIAACDNNIGIKGVAYNAKIIPIKIGLGNAWSDDYAISAFCYAYNHGADIISCSWGGGPESVALTETINTITENGRNGLGIPVLFASGNNNISSVSYPASLASTVAIGAMNPCGERKSPGSCDGECWGSNYGFWINAVAPGVLIPTTTINSSYVTNFNGTSSACPHAAGVMALILSANPCLTKDEAIAVLCSSCDKITGNGYDYSVKRYGLWNNEVGYGKINAFNAVKSALTIENSIHYDVISRVSEIISSENIVFYGGVHPITASGVFQADKYKITEVISFPYTENPIITGNTNGYSVDNPNHQNCYMSVNNLTNNSATLTTYCYNITGGGYSGFVPASPSNIKFNISVKDLSYNNVVVSNQSISSDTFNYVSYDTLFTNNIIIENSSMVNFHAGKCICIQDGTVISPTTGCIRAYIEPFNPCQNNARWHEDNRNSNDENIYEDLILLENNKSKPYSDVSIYPNPNNGSFYVSISNNENEMLNVNVTDAIGKKVFTNNRFKGGEIVLPNAKPGLYYVTVTLRNKTITRKIIIQ